MQNAIYFPKTPKTTLRNWLQKNKDQKNSQPNEQITIMENAEFLATHKDFYLI